MVYRYIYMIFCTAGSWKWKYYIGQHTTKNLNDGYKGSGTLIRKYYKKHPNDYIKSIICYCDSKEQLDEREKQCISQCINHPDCLNLQLGGHNGSPVLEVRKKIGEKSRGRTPWNKGKKGLYKASEETKKKIGEKSRGRTPWNKGGTSPRKGVKLTDETKQKLKEAAKNRKPMSEETKQKIRIKSSQHQHSEETKQKMRESALKRWHKINQNKDEFSIAQTSNRNLRTDYNKN